MKTVECFILETLETNLEKTKSQSNLKKVGMLHPWKTRKPKTHDHGVLHPRNIGNQFGKKQSPLESNQTYKSRNASSLESKKTENPWKWSRSCNKLQTMKHWQSLEISNPQARMQKEMQPQTRIHTRSFGSHSPWLAQEIQWKTQTQRELESQKLLIMKKETNVQSNSTITSQLDHCKTFNLQNFQEVKNLSERQDWASVIFSFSTPISKTQVSNLKSRFKSCLKTAT